MARKGLSKINASEFARYSLDSVLEAEKKVSDDTKYLSVDEALHDESVFENKSNRNITRVLFISRDESLLNPAKQSLDGYTNISDLFDEVHILILRQGIKARNPALRVAKNVWLYTASSKDWWKTPAAGLDLVREQLEFADGFRPDLIVARDPFESAYLAIKLGEKYKRPVQLHVVEDYFSTEWVRRGRHNHWRKFLTRFTIPKIKSIRTNTRSMYDLIRQKFTVKDLDILPRFNSYESLLDTPPPIDLRLKYKPLVFLMLYVGKLSHNSGLLKAIDAGRFGLRNPHIGLIVLGDGPARQEFVKRTEIFGIKEQVIFETKVKDVAAYMKSANVLIVTDTDDESEDIVLRGAAVGIPMVMARTAKREDVFVDGESALLCDPENTDEFSLKLNLLMNDIPLRKHMTEMSQNMIKAKFHDDPERYRKDYRDSIERVFFIDETTKSQ
jgi:glycosyltransferase involved in cell wall biosynthesis